MWKWDQGRIEYFQYDVLRTISRFAVENDLRNAPPEVIRANTGLPFPPQDYTPWRNYARVFKLCLIASELNGRAVPTDVAAILAQTGTVTCDEFIHFLAESTSDPSPALSDWTNQGPVRHPLCFALKYILAKIALLGNHETTINEIIGAYIQSGYDGSEDETGFIRLFKNNDTYADVTRQLNSDRLRQSRESIKFLCQISYLHTTRNVVIGALSKEDAADIFRDMMPIQGPYDQDGNAEIRRIAALFRGGSTHDFFDYQTTTISNELDSGFIEGSKVKRSHIVIERNSQLRTRYLQANPTPICDACRLDTHIQYPWTDRVLDVHHLLPLSSGTRVDSLRGTLLEDLVGVCPTCHRAIHRYYDRYLKRLLRSDFADRTEAVLVYDKAKQAIENGRHYA